nr:hypothetical protein Iba_chr04bCG2360 [Ipomoea batatas]GMC83546.1 hypothetical protein Iba_chr04cCG3070 [Ipomoea batatas]GMC85546.1 hypothetical protein Iba_chr04dCG2460 [Ipomoea batatas]GMC87665.1 hypothetical protein Iba_chr04eCG2650 [Ipomoea batatas]GMC89641.1 hypothetical protein Iba_chr04fCG0770 [Ipomoea batatas]
MLLCNRNKCSTNACLQAWKNSFDVLHQNLVQLFGQLRNTTTISKITINLTTPEELFLSNECILNAPIHQNILVHMIYNPNITKAKWNHFPKQKIASISTPVHNVQLCDYTNGSCTIRVGISSNLEGI